MRNLFVTTCLTPVAIGLLAATLVAFILSSAMDSASFTAWGLRPGTAVRAMTENFDMGILLENGRAAWCAAGGECNAI